TLCRARGIHAPMFWNANNTYGFGRVDFPILRRVASITTISRYMRMELLKVDVEAAILPNGIAERWLKPLPPSDASVLKKVFAPRPTFVKVARFDQDKRWLWAIDATAAMRDAGMRPRFIMRGSRSDYADVVGTRIRARGLNVDRLVLPATATPRDLASAISTTTGEVVFLDFFIAERTLRALYAAADGVLANSEKEPFGLVGLEVMSCGGIAYVGRTGEDYAVPFGNSIVMQSDDPRELIAADSNLRQRPELAAQIRSEGRATAKRFAWPRILDAYEVLWDTAFALTS
ncbi:MAG: glycosyltransferase family 4 protein, partial [Chloroflexota bacterium]|nr:glycosyltransferase family 4 protein [Chloroflexota bacterium]